MQTGLHAELVNRDFLLGIGDFETCAWVRWFSSYSGKDFDFVQRSTYVDPYNGGDFRSGYNLPTATDAVATGWCRYTDASINPGTNVVYQISSGTGIGGSNCQYFAIKKISAGYAVASLDHHVSVKASDRNALCPGDQITLVLDHVRMTDYTGLPSGSRVRYYARLTGAGTEQEIAPSLTAKSFQTTAVIPAGVHDINVQIIITTYGNLGSKQPGIYVDGAHLYVRRAGSATYEKQQVPVPRNRSINTQNVFFHPSWTDIYKAASDHDVLVTHEEEYRIVPVLRRLNPQMKILIYQSAGMCIDLKDSSGKAPIFKDGGFVFSEVRANNPQWLYKGGAGNGGFVNDSIYTERYFLRITDPDYQKQWASRVIEKVKRLGVDGVWIDDLSALDKQYGIDRPAWEVQNFLHAVYPQLRAAGVLIVQNAASQHINGVPGWGRNNGSIYFDPFWVPNATYPASAGFSANTPETVADILFQEHAFFNPYINKNDYDSRYWLNCLEDMDRVKAWNTAVENNGTPKLAANRKKMLHMWVLGREFPNDLAYGLDGWISFGLCSYLLAQNQWTALGARVEGSNYGVSVRPYPNIDYSITKKLGMPSGDHQPIDGDQYFRYREYVAAGEDSVGGVVVVNGRTNTSRTYRVDFDAVDQSGKIIPAGSNITLKPHTGRILLRGQSNVELTVDAPTQGVRSGQVIDIVVAYKNNGSAIAREATVRASVPAQMTYVPGSGEASGGTFDVATNTVNWNVGTLAIGQGGFRTFKARIK